MSPRMIRIAIDSLFAILIFTSGWFWGQYSGGCR